MIEGDDGEVAGDGQGRETEMGHPEFGWKDKLWPGVEESQWLLKVRGTCGVRNAGSRLL
jgi:hypothetical protein